MTTFLIIVVGVIGIVIAAFVQANQRRDRATQMGADATFHLGKYMVGLPGRAAPAEAVLCGVTDDDFIFLINSGDEIGRIPRSSVDDVLFEDKTQIAQRLSPRARVVVAPIGPHEWGRRTRHRLGSIWTGIQGQGGGATAATGERGVGRRGA